MESGGVFERKNINIIGTKDGVFLPILSLLVQGAIAVLFQRIKKRNLTSRESTRLKNLPETFIPNDNDFQAYKLFENAVNVNCVEYLEKQLFKYGIDKQ